jgi:hypothetical protein
MAKKKVLTVSELGKLGGKARAKTLTAKRRKEIAAMGGKATKGIKKRSAWRNPIPNS